MSYDDEMYSEDSCENEVRICAGCGCDFVPDEEGEVFCIDCRDDA